MSASVWGDDLPDSDLSLQVFRTPGRFTELLRGKGELGGDVRATLGRAAEAVRAGSFDRLDEAQRAALFFVQHVLLAEGADFYRVLGLRRGAESDEIKDHYHLLIRILHPDRSRWLGIDCEGLASRINIAHQTLSEPAKRLAYDRQLNRAPVFPEPEVVAPVRVVPKAKAVRRQGVLEALVGMLPLGVQRNFAQSVLGLAAFFGVLLVAGAYFSRPAAVARTPSEDRVAVHSGDAARAQVMNDGKGAPAGAVASAGVPSQAHEPGAGAGAPPAALREAAAVQHAAAAPPAVSKPPAPAPASAMTAAPAVAVAEPAGSAPPAPEVRALPPASPAPAVVNAPIAAAGVAAAVDPEAARAADELVRTATLAGIQPDEARAVALRFADAYRKGQIEPFLKLFSADARSPSGGLAEIRNDYAALFRDSQARSIELADFRWSFNGAGAQGECAYSIRVRKHGAASDEEYSGRLRFELVKLNGDVRIRGLFHKSS